MDKLKTSRQTLTGLIRSRVADYKARQLAGITQKTFAEELTQEGHPISYADFRTLYARARKQVSAAEGVTLPTSPQPPKEPKPDAIKEPESQSSPKEDEPPIPVGTHRPTDLDAIHEQEVDLRSLAKFAKRKKQ